MLRLRMFRQIPIVILFLISLHGKAQNIFPEKFKGCNTDHFLMERDTTKAKMSAEELVKGITQHFSPEIVKKIRGELRLQVIVDVDGSSCLISVENKTNIKTAKLDLKANVDKNLIWSMQAEKISPLIVLNFTGENIVVTRFGLGGKGIHELKQ